MWWERRPKGKERNRSTSEVILTLGNDVRRCHEDLIGALDEGVADANGNIEADYEYHARQLVRTIFAFVEGVTFSIKVKAVLHSWRVGKEVSEQERFFAVDKDHILSDKGVVVEKAAHIRLADNVRFAFALSEKVLRMRRHFDPSCEWWSCFKKSIAVRDRLAHPKVPSDIDITGDEIVNALSAYEGFSTQAKVYADRYIKFELRAPTVSKKNRDHPTRGPLSEEIVGRISVRDLFQRRKKACPRTSSSPSKRAKKSASR